MKKIEVIAVSNEFVPVRASKGAAGYDVKANIPDGVLEIKPGEKALIDLGVKVHLGNPNMAIHLMPRSGLSTKKELILLNSVGLVDSDYQGTIKACFKNLSNETVKINHLDRVAQLVFVPVVIVDDQIELVETFSDETERSIGGFGSTGLQFTGINYNTKGL